MLSACGTERVGSPPQALSAKARIHAAIAVAHAAAGRAELYRKHIQRAEQLTDAVRVDINAAWRAALSSRAGAEQPADADFLAAIDKTKAVEAVAEARARAGDYDGARAALDRIAPGRHRDARARLLAEGLADWGAVKEALATAEGIEEEIHRDLALLSVLGGCLRTGDRAGAEGVAAKVRTDAYRAAARAALNAGPADAADYRAAARYDTLIRRLARIQAQTPGRDRAAILRWIDALPQGDRRYYALVGAAEGILLAQVGRAASPPVGGGSPQTPATHPASAPASPSATQPVTQLGS